MTQRHKVRVRNGFSDRYSINPISKIIKIDNFDNATRIFLFNSLNNILEYQIKSLNLNTDTIAKHIVEKMFNEIYRDSYEDSYKNVINEILSIFKKASYDVILTVIEFLCRLLFVSKEEYYGNFNLNFLANKYIDIYAKMNEAFEEEYIGYRFINGSIVRITNDEEVKTIETACSSPFDKVNESISKSIRFISENGNKDYKNSIKESIMAVEQLFNILLDTNGLVLSNALEQVCQKITINGNLKQAIKSLFKYANDSNGIRHGNNKNEEIITFDEAKFILVTCSAIVNYFSKFNLTSSNQKMPIDNKNHSEE